MRTRSRGTLGCSGRAHDSPDWPRLGAYLINGQEILRYRGSLAKQLAVRYLQRYT